MKNKDYFFKGGFVDVSLVANDLYRVMPETGGGAAGIMALADTLARRMRENNRYTARPSFNDIVDEIRKNHQKTKTKH